jgi:hypothetical protein
MQPQDVFNKTYEATTASLDHWLASVEPDAVIDHERAADYWRVRLIPHATTACPVELMVSRQQTFDLDIGAESLIGQPITDLAIFQPLLEAVVSGHVVARTWSAVATGAPLTKEVIVTLETGEQWPINRRISAGTAATELSAIAQDRVYVPYRRD